MRIRLGGVASEAFFDQQRADMAFEELNLRRLFGGGVTRSVGRTSGSGFGSVGVYGIPVGGILLGPIRSGQGRIGWSGRSLGRRGLCVG